MFVEGSVLSTSGKPIPDAVIETWETDDNGSSFLLTVVARAICKLANSGLQDSTTRSTRIARSPTVVVVCVPAQMANLAIVPSCP